MLTTHHRGRMLRVSPGIAYPNLRFSLRLAVPVNQARPPLWCYLNAGLTHALADNEVMPTAAQPTFWTRVRRFTFALLGLWLAVVVLVPWFARELSAMTGFATLYGLAAKGTLLVFLAIIVGYAWWMDRLEARWLEASAPADNAAPVTSQTQTGAVPD
jgi:putative solute:sodium symporter small subunit